MNYKKGFTNLRNAIIITYYVVILIIGIILLLEHKHYIDIQYEEKLATYNEKLAQYNETKRV